MLSFLYDFAWKMKNKHMQVNQFDFGRVSFYNFLYYILKKVSNSEIENQESWASYFDINLYVFKSYEFTSTSCGNLDLTLIIVDRYYHPSTSSTIVKLDYISSSSYHNIYLKGVLEGIESEM
jgi:hypothetical protein